MLQTVKKLFYSRGEYVATLPERSSSRKEQEATFKSKSHVEETKMFYSHF